MSRKLQFTVLAVALGLVAGACSEQADPMSANDAGFTGVTTMANAGVVHHVSVGGNDACPTPGCDANFSLVANAKADGSVKGQWTDVFRIPNGFIVHTKIDCLNVIGNEAWVSGVVTGPNFTGLPTITRVADNGTSANDPLDQISFTFIDNFGGCQAAPDLPLFDLPNGQVKVR